MPTRYYSAIAQDTTLTGSITSIATTMTVTALTGYPSTPFVVAVDYNTSNEELVLVTGISGLTLNIQRHYNGTTAVAHNVGAVVRHVVIAQDLTDAQDHYDATTSVHGIADTSTLVTASGTTTLTNKTLTAPVINLALNAQTGTTYTPVLTDNGKLITLSNASAIAVTVPTNASVAYPVGAQLNLQQIGAGQVTIAGDTGVTVNGTGTKTRAQWSAATLVKTDTNTWTLIGDLA